MPSISKLENKFVFVHFLFQYDCVHEASSIKKWFSQFGVEKLVWPAKALMSTPSNTFGMNWKKARLYHLTTVLDPY